MYLVDLQGAEDIVIIRLKSECLSRDFQVDSILQPNSEHDYLSGTIIHGNHSELLSHHDMLAATSAYSVFIIQIVKTKQSWVFLPNLTT